MATRTSRSDRIWWVALLVAAGAAVGLVVAGFRVPVYAADSGSSAGAELPGSATLVDVNGPGVVIVLVVPLVITCLVGCALLLRRHRGALPVAWTLTALLAAFNLLAMLTIGVLVVPVTAALVVACAAASRAAPGTASPA